MGENNLTTLPTDSPIAFCNNEAVDAAGRLRISETSPVFDNKNIFIRNENQWEEVLNGVGASIAHLPDESSVALTVGTASGEYAIRQSVRYHAYVPGKGQYVGMTGVMAAAKTNVTQRLGYMDTDNGLFFEIADSAVRVVIRTSTSGSVVDGPIERISWDDPMDGSGVSGIDIDFTKEQLFIIDFIWQGVGDIRFGFLINGLPRYCHTIHHANKDTTPFMTTPSLPVRYEIRNTGISASSTTLKEICVTVASEGGYILPGYEFATSMGITKASVTTRTPILAIRLKNSFNSKENRRTARFLRAVIYADTNDVFFEIAHLHAPTETVAWSDVGGGSAIETAVAANITSVAGSPEHIIEQQYLPSGQGSSALAEAVDSSFVNLHSFMSQNFDSTNSQIFVIYATPLVGTADVLAGISWIEFD